MEKLAFLEEEIQIETEKGSNLQENSINLKNSLKLFHKEINQFHKIDPNLQEKMVMMAEKMV
jgi:hypothetical protein